MYLSGSVRAGTGWLHQGKSFNVLGLCLITPGGGLNLR